MYLNPSLRTSFMRMHRSSKHTVVLKWYSFFNLSDIERPEFEDRINPVLLPVLDQIEESLPDELMENLSTSLPKKRHESYGWTFLPAAEIAELNADADVGSMENGFFIIAWASYGWGAVSLNDGRVYFAHRFNEDCISPPDCEAESIADLLRKQTQKYLDYQW